MRSNACFSESCARRAADALRSALLLPITELPSHAVELSGRLRGRSHPEVAARPEDPALVALVGADGVVAAVACPPLLTAVVPAVLLRRGHNSTHSPSSPR